MGRVGDGYALHGVINNSPRICVEKGCFSVMSGGMLYGEKLAQIHQNRGHTGQSGFGAN